MKKEEMIAAIRDVNLHIAVTHCYGYADKADVLCDLAVNLKRGVVIVADEDERDWVGLIVDGIFAKGLHIEVVTVQEIARVNREGLRFILHWNLPTSLERYSMDLAALHTASMCCVNEVLVDPVEVSDRLGSRCRMSGRKAARQRAVIDWVCETGVCRRRFIEAYFGFDRGLAPCGDCDNCDRRTVRNQSPRT